MENLCYKTVIKIDLTSFGLGGSFDLYTDKGVPNE